MPGKLYLCATPIGNLEDITLRVLTTLKDVDLIAAEDTRHSIKLLNHFQINVALVTDAGTPGISDPGEELVRQCHAAGIAVTSLPGPAACITALTVSGLGTRRFCFEAFLPADKKERFRILEELKRETRTIIIYEAPHHLVKTLKELKEALGDRKISICRELTKRYEEVFLTTISGALERFLLEEPKGEFVFVLEGRTAEEMKREEQQEWENIPIEEHMERYMAAGMDKKQAMKEVQGVFRKIRKLCTEGRQGVNASSSDDRRKADEGEVKVCHGGYRGVSG